MVKMPEMEGSKKSTYRKKEFLKLTPGNHIIRLIPDKQGFYITYTHWIRGANIECLGEDECPICTNNRRIIAENPQNFRNSKGYSRKRQVFYVNVLDKTKAKVCTNCGSVNKAIAGTFPSVCHDCDNVIANVEPKRLNKICILNRGKELYTNLKSINNSILDEETGEKVGVENYDLMIMVPPETKRPVAQGLPHKSDPVEYEKELLFNVDEAPLQLEADEIKSYLNGVSLSDIFSARRAEDTSDMDYMDDEEDDEDVPFDDFDDVEAVEYDNEEVEEVSQEEDDEEFDEDVVDTVKELFEM